MTSTAGSKKSRKVEQLIAALLTSATIADAAKVAGIGDKTARRWMKDPDFAEQYRLARRSCMDQATAALQQAMSESVEALREIQFGGESEAARVSAARTIIDNALRSRESEDISARLDALEAALEDTAE
jgi:Holliday junction resolvasome RuvABC DNA-binding subunit